MSKSVLSEAHFHSEEAAFAFVEAWLWPTGPVCPFCPEPTKVGRLTGNTTRYGLCKCYGCRKQFTVRVGTVFESSHAPLRIWLQAIYLMCSSKKGISTRQLQRTLKVGMKTAWFLGHRIRHAMAPAKDAPKIGGEGKVIEADEVFLSNSPKTKKHPGAGGYAHKMAILSLVERDGAVRSTVLENTPTKVDVIVALKKHVDPASVLHTDGSQIYKFHLGVESHESVNHAKGEYARKGSGNVVHVNTAEGYFSVFRRGMIGTYQHVEAQHLQRYVDEFDFRQSTREKVGFNDETRAQAAIKGAKGKRLTYETTSRH